MSLPISRFWLVIALLCAGPTYALDLVPYDAGAFDKARGAGKVTGLLFHSGWCPICVMQERSLKSLKDDAALAQVTVFQADFGKEDALRKAHGVTSFSTLVIFRGGEERARTTGEFQALALKALFGKAL